MAAAIGLGLRKGAVSLLANSCPKTLLQPVSSGFFPKYDLIALFYHYVIFSNVPVFELPAYQSYIIMYMFLIYPENKFNVT